MPCCIECDHAECDPTGVISRVTLGFNEQFKSASAWLRINVGVRVRIGPGLGSLAGVSLATALCIGLATALSTCRYGFTPMQV